MGQTCECNNVRAINYAQEKGEGPRLASAGIPLGCYYHEEGGSDLAVIVETLGPDITKRGTGAKRALRPPEATETSQPRAGVGWISLQ